MTVPLEHDEQVSVVKWLKKRKIDHFAVPNGGARDIREATRLKAEGVTPGVSDLIITTPPPIEGIFAVALEMKRRKGGTMSDDQKAWHAKYEKKSGWLCRVAHGAKDAIKVLTELGYGT